MNGILSVFVSCYGYLSCKDNSVSYCGIKMLMFEKI